MDFCRAHQIAGIMIPTRSMITRNSTIFQPHVTGASEAIAIPNPTMQSRTIVSFPPLMRASSCSRRSTLWRPCNGVSSSAMVALPLMRVLAQKAHPGASVPRAKTPCAPVRPREGTARRAWVPSMDSVDDPLPLDQPGFLSNLPLLQSFTSSNQLPKILLYPGRRGFRLEPPGSHR